MFAEQLSLARQLDIVFSQLSEELSQLASGIVFVHIRNNTVGKFGLRHDPIQIWEQPIPGKKRKGLNEEQQAMLRKIALQSLQLKNNWTHGEIQFEFALRNDRLIASVQFESNYNMAAVLPALRLVR
jgi:predicted Rdx family selenoprotein